MNLYSSPLPLEDCPHLHSSLRAHLSPHKTSEMRSFLIELQPVRRWLCGISESRFSSVLLSNLRGQQPHGEHRPSSQEDMEALTSQEGEEISEVCPCSAPGTYRRCERLKEWRRGRRFKHAAFGVPAFADVQMKL